MVAAPITLDGAPAILSGVRNNYATVTALPHGPSFEWSWSTVWTVVRDRGGAFRS
jgi:hypothetical protein